MAKILTASDEFETIHENSYWALRSVSFDLETRFAQFVWRAYPTKEIGKRKNPAGQYIGKHFDTYSFNLSGSEFEEAYLKQLPVKYGGGGVDIGSLAYAYAMTRPDVATGQYEEKGADSLGEPIMVEKKNAFFSSAADDL